MQVFNDVENWKNIELLHKQLAELFGIRDFIPKQDEANVIISSTLLVNSPHQKQTSLTHSLLIYQPTDYLKMF